MAKRKMTKGQTTTVQILNRKLKIEHHYPRLNSGMNSECSGSDVEHTLSNSVVLMAPH
jgi:hypothetical protein